VSRSRRNFSLFLAFRATTRAILFAPYIQHFMTSVRALSKQEYGDLQAIYYVGVVALEVPSGVFADRFGRRWALVAGALTTAAGCATFAIARDFGVFAVGEVLFAAGTALISGADSALLYDSLAADRREGEYARAEGAGQAIWLLGTGIGFPLTGFFLVVEGDPVAAYWLTAGLAAAGALVACLMSEPPVRRRLTTREITVGAAAEVVRTPALARLVLYSAGVFALIRAAMVTFFDPAMKAFGLPVPLYGTVFCAVNLVGAFAAWRAHRWLDRVGERPFLVAMPVLMTAMLLAMLPLRHPAAASLFLLQGVVFAVYPLVVRARVNRLVRGAERRATILSMESLACRIGFALLSMIAGRALGAWGLNGAVSLTLLLALVPFGILAVRPRAAVRVDV